MFYLKHFFQVVFKNPLSGITFCFITIFLTVFSAHQSLYLNDFFERYRPKDPDPYFYTLITSNDEIESVARRLERLPGIKSVEIQDSQKITAEAHKIIKNIGVEIPEGLTEAQYKGMKVTLLKDVNARSLDLIKEYIVRLIGQQYVTISDIKVDELALDSKYVKLYGFLQNHGHYLIIMAAYFAWLWALFFFRKSVYKASYIIEHYQRKNNVSMKIVGFGLIFILSVSSLVTFFFGIPEFKLVLIIFAIVTAGLLAHLKKWSWDY